MRYVFSHSREKCFFSHISFKWDSSTFRIFKQRRAICCLSSLRFLAESRSSKSITRPCNKRIFALGSENINIRNVSSSQELPLPFIPDGRKDREGCEDGMSEGATRTRGRNIKEREKEREDVLEEDTLASTCPRGIRSRSLRRARNDEHRSAIQRDSPWRATTHSEKGGKKETFYRHDGSCGCLLAVGQRWGSRDRRK